MASESGVFRLVEEEKRQAFVQNFFCPSHTLISVLVSPYMASEAMDLTAVIMLTDISVTKFNEKMKATKLSSWKHGIKLY